MTMTQAAFVCTHCGSELPTHGRLLLGEVLHCSTCRAQFEVFDLTPLEIGPRARIENEEVDFDFDGLGVRSASRPRAGSPA